MAVGEGKIEWSQEAPTREKILFVAALGLMLYAFSVWLWGPQRDKTKIFTKEITQLEGQVETFEKILSVAVKPAETVPEAPQTEIRRESAAADPRFTPYLKGELKTQEQILQEVSGELATPKILGKVTLAGLDVGDSIDKGEYLEIPFDLRVEGTYQDTVNYLQRIEKIPILVVFRGMTVQAKADNPVQLETLLSSAAFVVKSAAALKESGGATEAPPSAPAEHPGATP